MENEKERKQNALLATVEAYGRRGRWLQYDQFSLDRVAQLSARRNAFLPPEASTEERYAFLDCSGFCWACFYQTFGYMLESALTWHMIDLCEPRVFYYELTHRETGSEISRLVSQVKSLLQPGDILVYSDLGGNGHAMLYLDETRYVNCSQAGTYNGYHYQKRKNYFSDVGGVRFEPTETLFRAAKDGEDPKLFRNYLFGEQKKRFAVIRPLDAVGEPTAQATARMNGVRDLYLAVTTGTPDGQTHDRDQTIDYRLSIRNCGEKTESLRVSFRAPENTVCLSDGDLSLSLHPDEETVLVFSVRPEAGLPYPVRFRSPFVSVNGFRVYAPEVEAGRLLTKSETAELLARVGQSENAVKSALQWYREKGVPGNTPAEKLLYRYFALQDSAAGDILCRYPPDPAVDMAAPMLYGGYGVVCPDNTAGYGFRATMIDESRLRAGDILLVTDRATCTGSYGALYTGKSLKGTFEPGGAEREMDGEEMAEFLDSLYGRFAFLVLRPSLTLR